MVLAKMGNIKTTMIGIPDGLDGSVEVRDCYWREESLGCDEEIASKVVVRAWLQYFVPF
jgi:hypothetical protein